jgi:WhiB family redox-sensing transcriptional regulator
VQVLTNIPSTAVARRPHPVDAVIAKAARCADPRSTYTSLFFSESPVDAARAKAICSRCTVRQLCLARALERAEPFGVWGGAFLVDGQVVPVRRGRGRPRKVALPTIVDEVTGVPADEVTGVPAIA